MLEGSEDSSVSDQADSHDLQKITELVEQNANPNEQINNLTEVVLNKTIDPEIEEVIF